MKKKHKDKHEEVTENMEASENSPEQAAEVVEAKPAEPTAAELKDQLLRLAAEYQNYQKRSMRQLEQATQYASENVVKSIIPVLDNFQHALGKGKDSGDIASIMQGVQIVYDHLQNTLQSAGMKKIQVEVGGSFDPAKHEALMHVESSEVEPNHIIMELAPGYEMNDRTLRPAKVSIAKAPQVEAPAEPADDSSETTEE